MSTVWIIDDDKSIRWVLEKALQQAGIETRVFEQAEPALNQLRREHPDAIITDIRMPGMDGLTLLKHANEAHPDLPVIIMTAHSDLESAVTSYRSGAFEYLPKPYRPPSQSFQLKKLLVKPRRCRKFFVRLVAYHSPTLPY